MVDEYQKKYHSLFTPRACQPFMSLLMVIPLFEICLGKLHLDISYWVFPMVPMAVIGLQ